MTSASILPGVIEMIGHYYRRRLPGFLPGAGRPFLPILEIWPERAANRMHTSLSVTMPPESPTFRSSRRCRLLQGVLHGDRDDRLRAQYNSLARFHRYWWDWQFTASQGGTCAHGLRISRPKRLDDCRINFESTGALASDNEYSGFAVAPAHYIAFAERKQACPYRVIYHLRRFT
ncbi:MAG: hypothetical protein CBCREVIR_1501 [Candidatus Burkholderia crenata]|nr:MAG: hypothetical protein CBCREVIR_1501 [Candidatus Burkholderia crenata]